MKRSFGSALAILLASSTHIASCYADTPQADQNQTVSPVPPEVLTEDEAAQLLRLERGTLIELVVSGKIPGRRVGDDWRFSRAALLGWLTGYQMGQSANGYAQTSTAQVEPPQPSSTLALDGSRRSSVEEQPAQQIAAQEQAPSIGTAPEGQSASEVFLRDQQILLDPNELVVDFGMFYAKDDQLILGTDGSAPVLGMIETDRLGGVVVARYSIGHDTEIFANTSYQDRQVAIIVNGRSFDSDHQGDFGDVGFGARHTVIHETVNLPDVILTVEGSVPTGDSSPTLGGGLTLVKSFDPSVLYGSINYRRIFTREFADVTKLQAGNRVDLELGYAFALNDSVILNSAVSGTINSETAFDNAFIRQNEIFTLRTGLTARISRNLFVQPSVSYQLNGAGNAVTFGLNFPYSF